MTNIKKHYQDSSKPKHGASKRDSKTQPSSSPSGHGGQHRSKKEDINPNRPSREHAYDPRDSESAHAEAGSTGQYNDPRRAHEFGLNRHAQATYAQEHPGVTSPPQRRRRSYSKEFSAVQGLGYRSGYQPAAPSYGPDLSLEENGFGHQ